MDLGGRDGRSLTVLDVGDPRRMPVGRAILEALAVSAAFLAFAFAAKEIEPLYARTPWADDPYDAVVSFAIFFLPLVVAVALVRLPLCRRDEPLPVVRVTGLVRASIVLLGIVILTIAADWLSVLLRERGAAWSPTTGILVVLLAGATLMAARATRDLRRATRGLPRSAVQPGGPDWLADVMTLAARGALRLGPLAPGAVALIRSLDRLTSRTLRRRPILAAGLFSVVFGVGIAAAMAREEGIGVILALFCTVATCGMFAFTVAAGAYLGLVRAERPLAGRRRRLADALVLAASAVPVALALRGSLLWIVGSNPTSAGVGELEALLVVAATATFSGVLIVEAAFGLHRLDDSGLDGRGPDGSRTVG